MNRTLLLLSNMYPSHSRDNLQVLIAVSEHSCCCVVLIIVSVLYLSCSHLFNLFICLFYWFSVYPVFTFRISFCVVIITVVLSICHHLAVVVYFVLPLLAIYIFLCYHNVQYSRVLWLFLSHHRQL